MKEMNKIHVKHVRDKISGKANNRFESGAEITDIYFSAESQLISKELIMTNNYFSHSSPNIKSVSLKYLFLVLIISMFVFFFSKESMALDNEQKYTEFVIARGETTNGFTFTTDGVLLYNKAIFSPPVSARYPDIPKFKISILNSKQLAAAISLDQDGKTQLFLMDLKKGTSREIYEGGVASQIYWSPSGKYLVVLCSYEGERFISIDLATGKVLNKDFIKPKDPKRLWRITKDFPAWAGKSDFLEFTVNEICNYYEDHECGEKIFAVHSLKMDAASLTIENVGAKNKKQ